MTAGAITDYLAADHRRLELLLDAAERTDPIDLGPYDDFCRGLLRHIGLEEKILLPAAQAARGGAALDIAGHLRLDHGAIAALLVPTPTPTIVATLRHILCRHNALEEGAGGLYAQCDRLLRTADLSIVARMEAYTGARASPHNDAPAVMPAVVRALERAGYRLVDPTVDTSSS
jgi:hypothetical protein